jgi:23S rRNA (adenine2503-C2)-methyltransferase
MEPRTVVVPDDRPNLFGMDRVQIGEELARYDAASFHANQVYRWIYARRRFDPTAWTDLAKPLRSRLADETRVDPGSFTDRAEAGDGTVKYRTRLPGGGIVECVYMVQNGRVTMCLSSQVGCALDCDFCLTGKMGFGRHLTVGEIVGQVALIQEDRRLDDRAFNLVFMGMGEPLHNYDSVLAAIRLLTDPDGFAISRHRITVSTSGMAPGIEKLAGEKVRPRLAVSLNATTDETRDRLMPINKKYDIERLLDACRSFARATGDRFTFEYVLLAGVNDTPDDVRRLARIGRRLPAKINLIPFNPVPGLLAYRPPSRSRVLAIRDQLLEDDLPVSIRWSRGGDARAACGQLALLESDRADGPAAQGTQE